MAVELALFRQLLFLLRRHRCRIGAALLAARAELAARDLILGLALVLTRRFANLSVISASQRTMHAAEQPAQAKRDSDRGVRLRLDGIAQRPLERAGGLARRAIGAIGNIGGAVAGLAVKVLGGIRHVVGDAAGLFLGIAEGAAEIGIGGASLRP